MRPARAYTLNLTSFLLLLFCASVMAGRVWRFPFDDEIYTMRADHDNSIC